MKETDAFSLSFLYQGSISVYIFYEDKSVTGYGICMFGGFWESERLFLTQQQQKTCETMVLVQWEILLLDRNKSVDINIPIGA